MSNNNCRIILMILIIMLLSSCGIRQYYRTIRFHGFDELENHARTYFLLIKNQNDGKEYLINSRGLYSLDLYINKEKSLFKIYKEIRTDCLQLDSLDCTLSELNYYNAQPTPFKDSLSRMSSEDILKTYFIDNILLNDSIVSKEQADDIMYTFAKRKKLISYMFEADGQYYPKKVYYGKMSDVYKYREETVSKE